MFHEQVAASFFKPVGDHRELEPARHRQFLNVTFAQLRNCACAVAALAVEENSPANAAPVVARFRDQVLCVGKPKPQLAERIAAQLEGTFPNSAFKLQIE